MHLLSAVAALVLVVVWTANGDPQPCQRNGVRCLDYQVTQTNQDYEERRYPSVVWVSASETAKSKSDVSRKLIKKLYAYLGGDNDRAERLDMTVPVRTTKVPLGSFNRYTMSIALKPEQSAQPPVPSDGDVTVSREPPTSYITRSFGGQIRQESRWDEQAETLKTSASGVVNTTFYFMSVYDSPWTETERLNEVWMIKKKE